MFPAAARLPSRARAALLRFSSSAAAEASPAESSNTRRAGALLFSSACGVTACLCGWQLNRHSWKVQLMDERAASLAHTPRPLRELVPDPASGLADDAQFQRVSVEGSFDHAYQVLLGPRSAPAGAGVGGNAPAGAANQSGWDVLTPLTCLDGTRILVNRGWVPRDAVNQLEQPAGKQVVSGVLKAGEARNKYATNDVANGRYIWLDLPTLAAATESYPLYVVAVNDPADVATSSPDARGRGLSGGAPGRGAPPRWPHARPVDAFMQFHVTPGTHLVYAATWASLSVAGAVITYLRFVR